MKLYQEILQSPNGALVWSFLKPVLHGKILYTPNTPEIQKVIQKVSCKWGSGEPYKQDFWKQGVAEAPAVLDSEVNVGPHGEWVGTPKGTGGGPQGEQVGALRRNRGDPKGNGWGPQGGQQGHPEVDR